MRTVELFSGIGGFRIASDLLGHCTIWANDIGPQACMVYRSNFGKNELVEGSIYNNIDSIPAHDILTAGFPCQPFSSAGKKKGIRDPRGALFETIIKVLKTHEPSVFILENVKRLLSMENGCHFATILNALSECGYFIEWRLLNACNFGLAQNRQRVIIVGFKKAECGQASYLATGQDLASVDYNHLMAMHDSNLWQPVDAHSGRFPSWGLCSRSHFCGADLAQFSESVPLKKLKDTLERDTAPKFDYTDKTIDRLKKNIAVNRFVNGVEIISNQNGGARMGYTIFGIEGVAPTLTAATSRHYERYYIGGKYRRLTNIEYARLQGFPDQHCRLIPICDQYRLYGNAVPPAMIEWVMKRIESAPHSLPYPKVGNSHCF